MPGITPLVALISLDVTSELVASGIVANGYPLTITGATKTTPIVLTLSQPAPFTRAIHAVVSGVAGMTEANGTWVVTPTSPGASTVTLTTYSSAGAVTNSVGVNVYTSGGTITTALSDGRIVLGAEHESENVAPPRIIFTPTSSKFAGPDTNDRKQGGVRLNTKAGANQTAEQILEQAARMVAGENLHFEVTCWGAGTPPDPDLDFDVLQALYQQVLRSLYHLIEGCFEAGTGRFVDQQDGEPQRNKLGHKMRLPLDIYTPILDYALGTTTIQTINATAKLQASTASTPETAWSGSIT